jgi:hypothetical protein
MILHRRGAAPHLCSFVNAEEKADGFGLFYRVPFGNTPNVQDRKPTYVPKPSYFALRQTREFLATATFVDDARLPDRNPEATRAYVYRTAAGRVVAAVWRVDAPPRDYRTPGGWRGAVARDVFGSEVAIGDVLTCAAVPTFVQFPEGYAVGQVLHDLRTLDPADGADRILLALHVGEPDSCQRAGYRSSGTTRLDPTVGRWIGGRTARADVVTGLATESFAFESDRDQAVLLTREWFFDGVRGQRLFVRIDDGDEQEWDLTASTVPGYDKIYRAGLRESSFVLPRLTAGRHVVTIRYAEPGNCVAYRATPLVADRISTTQWGMLAGFQTRGEILKFRSGAGTPLGIGKASYADGLGCHANSAIEYPLNRQFDRFDVEVGIDTATNGRGSVRFRVLVDGVEKAASGAMTGFTAAASLTVTDLASAQRLLLLVEDGGDGNQDDLANWVNGSLTLRRP